MIYVQKFIAALKTSEVTKMVNNRMIKKTVMHRFDGIVISQEILWI